MGKAAVWGLSVKSLMLARYIFGSGCSQIGLDKWTFMFLSLCGLHFCHHESLFIILLGRNMGEWGRYMTDTQGSYCVYLSIKTLFWGAWVA